MSILTDDPPPSMRAVWTTGSRSPRNSDLLPLSTVTVLDPGARCETNRKGVVTVGSPWLLDPASIRRMDREGSASESRDATMHPDVPPVDFESAQASHEKRKDRIRQCLPPAMMTSTVSMSRGSSVCSGIFEE